MSVMEGYTLFWVLPSLIAFLLASDVMRRFEKTPIQRWRAEDWIAVIFCSVIFPLAFMGWVTRNSRVLVKERRFKS